MASRNVRGEAVPWALKQKNMAPVTLGKKRSEAVPRALKQKNMAPAPLGKNRIALGDIGNMKSLVVNGGLPGKPALKPKPEMINLTSDDSDLPVRPAARKPAPKPKPDSLIKKATLSSTLTARSKAFCGLSHKPKVQIVDIDAADVNNELAVVEYVEDIYKFYKIAENENRVGDYIDSQSQINKMTRAILVDWLIEVHHKFKLSQETLYLTINILDRYLALTTTSRSDLQLVGASAMLIASKYEEIWAPEVNDFVCISDRAYTHERILAMEKRILGTLEWYLTVPTHYMFLVRFIKAGGSDAQMGNMVYFLAELAMMNYSTIIYCPSMVAAAAVYVARRTLHCTPFWNDTLELHTGFSESQLMDCAKLLVSYHMKVRDHKLKAIYNKYSSSSRGAVALQYPAKSFLAAAAVKTLR